MQQKQIPKIFHTLILQALHLKKIVNLITEVDKLDIDKLVPVPVDLIKLSDVVKNHVLTKPVYDKLVEKVDTVDTSRFGKKAKCDTDKSELEKKLPDVTDLAKKIKNNGIEDTFPDINGLATETALTVVENKIPDVISLVKDTAYKTKISEIEKKISNHNHDKYITAAKFNTLAAGVFDARLAQANLITKREFDTKLNSLNKKINSNKTKHLYVENELKKLKSFNLGNFIRKSHFDADGSQIYLEFQPILRYLTPINTGSWITGWKSKGLSDEVIVTVSKTDNTPNPTTNGFDGNKTRLRFAGNRLRQRKITCKHGRIVNIYIVYEIINSYSNGNYPTLEYALFGTVKLTKRCWYW